MTRVTIIAAMALVSALCQNQPKKDLVLYQWSYNGNVHGSIWVPHGYKATTENYREGIVTHLRYPDSSCIVLQHGGMYAVPMLYESQYLVAKSDERNDRMIRIGSVQGTDRCWREDNLKRDVNKRNQIHPLFYMFPPNIAYDDVPKEKVDLFNRSLNSFVWNAGK